MSDSTQPLRFKEKLGYGLGDSASNFFFQVFNIFLLYYYTDIFGIDPALIGVMFIVVIGTFEWSSFRVLRKVPRSDAMVLVLVSAVTVATDLAIAVVVGVIVSALVFAWQHAKYILIEAREDHKGSTVYAVTGPLFFGSVTSFLERFDPDQDNDDVRLGMGAPSESDQPDDDVPLDPDDVLLVTGGGKGITAECALAIARQTGVRLGLLGRASADDDVTLRANLERLRSEGVSFLYVAAAVPLS